MRQARVLALLVFVLHGAGCLSARRYLEVRLNDLEEVDLQMVHDDRREPLEQVRRTRGDIVVGEGDSQRSMLAEGEAPANRTVRERIRGDAPNALPTTDGSFVWRRRAVVEGKPVEVIARTPVDNVERAHVLTWWSQPAGIVPSLAYVTLGGIVALGAGTTAIGLPLRGSKPPEEVLPEAAGFALFAVSGAALATYGVISWSLVSGSPTATRLEVTAR